MLSKLTLVDKSVIQDNCDNYIYNYYIIDNLIDLLLNKVITTIIIKYNKILKFVKVKIFAKQKKLLSVFTEVRIMQTLINTILVFKKTLNRFAIQI